MHQRYASLQVSCRVPLLCFPLLAIGMGTWDKNLSRSEEPAAQTAITASSWNLDRLQQRAAQLAARPYEPSPPLPDSLRSLDYDSYRLIVFRHEKAIWKSEQLPFWLECFHRGYLFKDQVTLSLIEKEKLKQLSFDSQLFQYRGALSNLQVPSDTGFAGFRILGRFEGSPHPLEIASFLGASYFRAIGPGQFYGTSARGLAIDIGLPKAEEFPVFREFWIEQPSEHAKELKLWALMDSPSVAGAYEFLLRPGAPSVWEVQARLCFREQPEKIGLAPLTSMWMWGKGRSGPEDDPRPEVHDADGLLIATAEDQWIWRPLTQQNYPSVSHYDLEGLRGFGLLQRERNPQRYQDQEAKYALRPGVWIEPLGDWPAGAIELLELPAKHEGMDNIAAWWSLKQPVKPGQTLDLHYKISFGAEEPPQHNLAKAQNWRVIPVSEKTIRVEVEFVGTTLSQATSERTLEPDVTVQRGRVDQIQCRILSRDRVQLSFEITPESDAPMELSAVLTGGESILSETWRYLCPISSN